MAKTKISELEKMFGADRKEIIAFLNEKGIDAKTANSSVDDDAVRMVEQKFAKPKAAPKAPAAPAQTPRKEGTPVKPGAPAGDAASRAEQPKSQQAARPAAPKKKKIIIVTGNAAPGGGRPQAQQGRAYNSGSGAGYGGQRQGQRQGGVRQPAQQGGRTRLDAQRAYHPIKPLTAPTQMQVDYHKPAQNVPRPKPAPEKPVQAEEAAAAIPAPEQENQVMPAAAEVQAPAAPVSPAAETAPEPVNTEPAVNTAAEAAAGTPERPLEDTRKEQHLRPAERRPERAPERTSENRGENRGERPQERRGQSYGQQQRGTGYGNQRQGQGQGGSRSGGQGVSYAGQQRGGTRPGGQGRPSFGDRAPFRQGQGGQRPGGQGAPFAGQGRGGARPGQGRPGAGAPGAGRPGFSDGRNRRGGQGGAPGAFGGDAKKRDNKRTQGQDRDKRRKDLTFTEDEERTRKNRSGRFIRPEKKEEAPEEQIKVIVIPERLTIRELAEKMRMQPAEIIKKLFLQGKVTTVNSELSYEDAEAIALEYEILCEKEQVVDVIEELLKEDDDTEETLKDRPPVICVMGHVDHGKTSLLDAIRKTNVTDKEAGGITQHIGAYTVSVGDRKITFLDTPGHEAFTAMRMRGANSTDIAVLVVAADDGVMPQTIEAINHAKAAGVEIIVAINKIDKPEANPERVKQMMTEYELVPTDWGGTTEFVPVSAKTGEGIENLLETILLTADILELKANPDRLARGLVLEAKLDKGRGPVANVLIQKGTLHVGDPISAGACYGRVRAMVDDKGRRVKEAKPSQPVEVLGLSDVPGAGEVIIAHAQEKEAKSFAETYQIQHKADLIEETRMRMSLDDLFNQMKEGNLKEFNLIIKADVQGSAEALRQSLVKLSNEEVVVKVIHCGVGAISESDVSLASASNAVIIGFNVKPDPTAKSLADSEGVDVHLYSVIYQAIDDVEAALKGMLAPVYEEKVIGHAEVRQIFRASAIGNIAGAMVTDGVMQRGCKIRITRDGEQIYEGQLSSLKRFKDDAKEVREGFECGLVFDGFDKMNVGDIAEAYILVEVPRT